MKTHLLRRRGSFESLEQRQLLAGDVLVSVVHGNLKIEGDANDNQIEIAAGAEAHTVVITGLDETNLRLVDRETGVPGPAESELVVSVRGGAKIDLGDGDDAITMTAPNLRGNLSINTGDGDDQVVVNNATDATVSGLNNGGVLAGVRGDLKIRTGAGDDTVIATNALVRGRLHIDTGSDNDSVELGGVAAENTALSGGFVDASLRGRGGVHVSLGDGNDIVNVQGIAASHLHLAAGDGDDSVVIADVDVHRLSVNAGAGNDDVSVADSVFASLGVKLGDGDDTLALGGAEAKFALLLGGMGEDTLNELAENNLVHDLTRGFELPLIDVVDRLPVVDQLRDKLDRVLDRVADKLPSLDDAIPDLSASLKGKIAAGIRL
jgi:hypothetical protein